MVRPDAPFRIYGGNKNSQINTVKSEKLKDGKIYKHVLKKQVFGF